MSVVELSIHNVTRIEQCEVVEFPEGETRAFFTRDLIITNEKGEAIRIQAYAWDEKSLEIKGG